MAVPAPTNFAVVNPGFEDGNVTGWTARPDTPGLPGVLTLATDNPYSGSNYGLWVGTAPGGSSDTQSSRANIINNARGTVAVGQSITVSGALGMNDRSNSANQGEVRIYWLDANDNIISYNASPRLQGNSSSWRVFSVTASAPAGAVYAAPGFWVKANAAGGMRLDALSWSYTYNSTAVLTQPTSANGYTTNDQIPLRVTVTPVGLTVQQVIYKRQTYNGVDFDPPITLATVTADPWAANVDPFAAGTYRVFAEVYMSDGSYITTNVSQIAVSAPAPLPRLEYNASNAYAYVIAENILNLGEGLPPTAVVTGIVTELAVSLQIISRVKDTVVTDISQYTNKTPFDIIQSGSFETALMSKSNGAFTVLGSPTTVNVDIQESDFTLTQTLKSEEFKLVNYTKGESSYSVGGEQELFNLGSVPASDFLNYALGVRFYPNVNAKPAYADYGDAVVRTKIGKLKIRVYFDAGSVVYYFASPDRTKIIKATLVAYNVNTGNFKNGDASGVLQLSPELEIIAGSQTWIGDDWTIHSGEPTDNNLIGYVSPREEDDGIGMSYNGLATQQQVYDNRSRYLFITANFYGDLNLESMYGANGYDRGFAYNGREFYKIQTQANLDKDKPRHVAFHHSHLALGFEDGRVDISVVGEPYNYDGAQGASSWAIGDSVTGLLPLAGSILGVFCKKSVAGIAGTTVDNFATQTVSPAIGAVEYTIADMGFPVYANAYGVYTLAQTQQYGDYLGSPMSQPISPWLRPRLVRKYTSDKEVVVAWPVRSKNQYKLAFSDGYVMSMTMNYGQQSAPTFSKQKYFVTDEGIDYGDISLYEYPSIYPIAVSSQLDDGGEERIHVANLYSKPQSAEPSQYEMTINNGVVRDTYFVPFKPPLLQNADFIIRDSDTGETTITLAWQPEGYWLYDGNSGDPSGLWILEQGSIQRNVIVTTIWS